MDNTVATTEEETGTDITLMPCMETMCAIAFTTTASAVKNTTTEGMSDRVLQVTLLESSQVRPPLSEDGLCRRTARPSRWDPSHPLPQPFQR